MAVYVQPDAFKATTSVVDNYSDADIDVALNAASRAVEKAAHRKRFDKDAAPVIRLFTARSPTLVAIDDAVTISTVKVDGSAVTAYVPEPLNATADGRPFTWLASDDRIFTSSRRGGIEVTGVFGWPSVPSEVVQLTTIIAAKLLKRSREAPWGIVSAGGIEGAALRITREDPDMQLLLRPITRPLVGWR